MNKKEKEDEERKFSLKDEIRLKSPKDMTK